MHEGRLSDIKRKLRKLKQAEKKIRRTENEAGLVWNDFFAKRYPLDIIAAMSKETYKRLIDEYFFHVYYRHYTENETAVAHIYDPEALSRLGLPYDADFGMIKSRFRELAKIYHPDAGGDSADFIGLMNDYKRLDGK